MPRQGYRRPGTVSAQIFFPKNLHGEAVNMVESERKTGRVYSLHQLVIDAVRAFVRKGKE